jgi:hypothetical protein
MDSSQTERRSGACRSDDSGHTGNDAQIENVGHDLFYGGAPGVSMRRMGAIITIRPPTTQ